MFRGQCVRSLLFFFSFCFFFYLKICSSEQFPPNIPMRVSLCHSCVCCPSCPRPWGSRRDPSLLLFPCESCSRPIKLTICQLSSAAPLTCKHPCFSRLLNSSFREPGFWCHSQVSKESPNICLKQSGSWGSKSSLSGRKLTPS